MQVSLSWLNDFVDLVDKTPEQIAHELTMSGLEVEEIEEIKPKFTNIITAKMMDAIYRSAEPHQEVVL